MLNHMTLPFLWVEDSQTSTIIGRAAMSPGLVRVALSSGCPVGPSGTAYMVI